MQDRPTASELTEAVREFLQADILPDLHDPRTRFRMLVAVNALGILERQLEQEELLLRAEYERLARLLDEDGAIPGSLEKLRYRVADLNRDLSERIRSGKVPEGAFGLLKQTVEGKLKIANPRYLERYD